jgi:hypothetical protein
MSIEEQSAIISTSEDKNLARTPANEMPSADGPDGPAQSRRKRWYTPLLSPLWLCLLVALIIRIWLIVRTHGILDADEALVGIQAERVLHGNFPVYFYGIPYFGSLEAYLVSIFVAIFGPSTLALRVESTILSLVLVCLAWRLASLLAEAAQLPLYAKRCFTIVAALVAAVPPLYDGIIELRTWGGWIETFVLMLLLLISALRLTSRWREGASYRELALRWAGIGFIVGLGMWVYPLITTAVLAAAIWIVGDRIAEIVSLRQDPKAPAVAGTEQAKMARSMTASIERSISGFILALAAIPTCLLGFLPGILWGATHQWENIAYIRSLGGTWSRQKLHTVKLVTQMYGTCIAPRVVSGGTPLESRVLATIHSPLFLFSLFFIFATTALVAISLLWHHPVLLRVQRLAALPTLFAASAVALYCISSVSHFSLISCNLDLTGRYASPLALTLPFFFATIFTLLSMLIASRISARTVTTAPSPRPFHPRSYGLRVPHISIVLQIFLFALLLAYFSIQAGTYGLTDADQAFQSPYCTIAPANYDPIIAYMQQEHIHYAWASNLLGYPIVFKTNSNIIVVDPLPLMHPSIAINRIPSYTDAVKNADRPAFLVFVQHGNPHPRLLQLLDADHVTYHAKFFPSENGVDVMVVTPLSRTVSPFESKEFDFFYCNTQ